MPLNVYSKNLEKALESIFKATKRLVKGPQNTFQYMFYRTLAVFVPGLASQVAGGLTWLTFDAGGLALGVFTGF